MLQIQMLTFIIKFQLGNLCKKSEMLKEKTFNIKYMKYVYHFPKYLPFSKENKIFNRHFFK